MKPPRIPPMAAAIILNAFTSLDDIAFTELAACPDCGGAVTGHDMKEKQFAVIADEKGTRIIHVKVKRFRCRECGRLCYADEPFYPDTRIGSPVIDLCVTLSATMPAGRAARVLEAMGVIVDRTSCLLYAKKHTTEIQTADVFGMRLPFSVLTLANLAAAVPEGERITGADVLAACGFPSGRRPPGAVHAPGPQVPHEGSDSD
ncbi:hypothetical protein [Methanoregula sp.]|jgi:hypothetical protein|uniref:hypothetical protein n=1 Tax=Methanoregula sp. TaxID=2052170 RepID=UPI003C189C88